MGFGDWVWKFWGPTYEKFVEKDKEIQKRPEKQEEKDRLDKVIGPLVK